jgi:serine/threonine-protein kinase
MALDERFEIERELGRGGMATVFLAHDRKHDRQVALKVLRPDLGWPAADRFHREIRIAARLAHPNIAPLFDSGEADGLLYFVMQYVEGAESLRARLERAGILPLEEAVMVVRDVALALDYAHRHGLVHRDIKPENILLAEGRAVVLDFGIARAPSPAVEGATEAGLIIGTPRYMSPEQAAGGGLVDARSDIYSLGCVFFEALAGSPPFNDATPQAVVLAHLGRIPPALATAGHDVPPWASAIVARCLEKDPADRFQAAAELLTALARPTRASVITRAAPPVAARTRAMLGLVAALLLLLLLAYPAWRMQQRTGNPAQAPLPDITRIAVFYFEADTGQELRDAAAGLTEDLIDELGSVAALRVISSDGVRRFRGTAMPLDSAARLLGVGTLVTGTLSGSVERPKLVVRMVDATGAQLASRTLEPATGDLLTLRRELADSIAGFLRRRLGQEIRLRGAPGEVHDRRAWLLVRRANDRREDAQALRAAGDLRAVDRALTEADSLLKVAEALEPTWPEPGIQRAWVVADRMMLAPDSAAAAARALGPKGIGHADRVLARHPGLPAAREARGAVRLYAWLFGDQQASAEVKAAESDLRAAAVPENPTEARAWSMLSALLIEKGEFDEANLAAERALERDAFLAETDEVLFRLHLSAMLLQRWPEAAKLCKDGRARFASDWRFTFCELSLMVMPTGKPPDPARAWALTDELSRLTPTSDLVIRRPRWQMMVASVLARAGLRDSAGRVAAMARRSSSGDNELDFYEATVGALLGDTAAVIRLLQQFDSTHPGSAGYLKSDPILGPITATPRVAAALAEPIHP